jgi:hypothetical protein
MGQNNINNAAYAQMGTITGLNFTPEKMIFCASGHTLHANANMIDFDLYQMSTTAPFASLINSNDYGTVNLITSFHPIVDTNYVVMAD